MTRHLTAAAVLAAAVLTLTACGPDKEPSPAPPGSAAAPAAGTASGTPTAPAGAKTGGTTTAEPAGADVQPCTGSEKEKYVTGEMVGLEKSADARWSGVVKLTNVTAKACVMYGAADLRTDGTPVYTKLVTGVLGGGTFAADKAHGTVLRAGASVFHAVTWYASPPVAPNAECTTGSHLVLARNEEGLFVDVPVKDARYCPAKEIGSPQVLIGVPQPTLAEAKAQLRTR
jgi:hypothetical protein